MNSHRRFKGNFKTVEFFQFLTFKFNFLANTKRYESPPNKV